MASENHRRTEKSLQLFTKTSDTAKVFDIKLNASNAKVMVITINPRRLLTKLHLGASITGGFWSSEGVSPPLSTNVSAHIAFWHSWGGRPSWVMTPECLSPVVHLRCLSPVVHLRYLSSVVHGFVQSSFLSISSNNYFFWCVLSVVNETELIWILI